MRHAYLVKSALLCALGAITGCCLLKNTANPSRLGTDKAFVHIDVLFEALCPFCQKFFKLQLVPILESPLRKHITINLVPFGNGSVRAEGKVDCQHGPQECLLNEVAACSLSHVPDQALRFVSCMESGDTSLFHHGAGLHRTKRHQEMASYVTQRRLQGTSAAARSLTPIPWQHCTSSAAEKTTIEKCAHGQEGEELLIAYAEETASFGHKYVPWVVINNEHEEFFEHHLSAAVCAALKSEARDALSDDVASFCHDRDSELEMINDDHESKEATGSVRQRPIFDDLVEVKE